MVISGDRRRCIGFKPTVSSDDYRHNRDPALTAILAGVGSDAADNTLDGRWQGKLSLSRWYHLRVVVAFGKSGHGWDATLDLPQNGALDLPLENVRFENPDVHFELPDEDGLIVFNGAFKEGRIIGEATRSTRVFRFILVRASQNSSQ